FARPTDEDVCKAKFDVHFLAHVGAGHLRPPGDDRPFAEIAYVDLINFSSRYFSVSSERFAKDVRFGEDVAGRIDDAPLVRKDSLVILMIARNPRRRE